MTEHEVVRAVARGANGATEVLDIARNVPEWVGYRAGAPGIGLKVDGRQ